MRETRAPDEHLDRLVRRFLQSEQEKVDAEAFLTRLRERRERRVRIMRFPARLAAVAAVLAIVAGAVLLSVRRAPQQPGADLLALDRCLTAFRDEIAAAWRGARAAGSAAVSAGNAPLQELADSRIAVPDFSESARAALEDLFDMSLNRLPSHPEENDR